MADLDRRGLNTLGIHTNAPVLTEPPHGPERAAWTRELMDNALARPEFVGWHMCGIIDTSKEMPRPSTGSLVLSR